jgi:hypothetical protein
MTAFSLTPWNLKQLPPKCKSGGLLCGTEIGFVLINRELMFAAFVAMIILSIICNPRIVL